MRPSLQLGFGFFIGLISIVRVPIESALLNWLAENLKLALIAVPILAFAEAFVGLGLFVSSALLVIASSIVYENELLDIVRISSLAFLGALLGDQGGFYIGKWMGPYFYKIEFVRRRQNIVQKANNMISNYGSYVIFLGRFLPAIRSIIPAMLGIAGFNSFKFLVLDLLACLLWCSALAAIILGIGTIL